MVAVISGDIIDSSKLPPTVRESLIVNLENLLKSFSKKDKAFTAETNKGDWFQCLVKDPSLSLRYALIFKAYLKSLAIENRVKEKSHTYHFDARVSVGVGEVDFIGTRLGNSDGAAFRLSGRMLESIKSSSRSIVAVTEKSEDINEELDTLLHLLDFIFSKTTSLQCEVIYRKLIGMKETDIAKELHIIQSAVNQRSTAAGWKVIEDAIKRFETIISRLNG